MKICRKKTVEIEEIQDIVCNKCGKSCKTYSSNDYSVFGGLLETNVQGGYDSIHLEDQTNYGFSLCEKCLTDLFKTFEIPVEEKFIGT